MGIIFGIQPFECNPRINPLTITFVSFINKHEMYFNGQLPARIT